MALEMYVVLSTYWRYHSHNYCQAQTRTFKVYRVNGEVEIRVEARLIVESSNLNAPPSPVCCPRKSQYGNTEWEYAV